MVTGSCSESAHRGQSSSGGDGKLESAMSSFGSADPPVAPIRRFIGVLRSRRFFSRLQTRTVVIFKRGRVLLFLSIKGRGTCPLSGYKSSSYY